MNKLTGLLAASTLVLAGTANAFDDHRAGFQIGLGLGMSQTVVESTTATGFSTDNANELAGTVSVGFGLNDHLSIYLGGLGTKASGHSEDSFATVAGVGGTLYFSRKPTSLYVTGMYGLGSLGKTSDQRGTDNSAPAWLVGAGFQFSQHMQFQLSYTSSGTIAEDQNSNHDFQAALATVNFVWN